MGKREEREVGGKRACLCPQAQMNHNGLVEKKKVKGNVKGEMMLPRN